MGGRDSATVTAVRAPHRPVSLHNRQTTRTLNRAYKIIYNSLVNPGACTFIKISPNPKATWWSLVEHEKSDGTVPSVSAQLSVLELIKSRQAGHKDNYRLALALEGGGMRGVVSASMMMALRDLGVDRVFDCFYGTSSGSINLAYFAGGGSWPEVAIYYDYLTDGFIRDIYRSPHKPPLNMAYVFEDVMLYRRPINVPALLEGSYDVRIVLTDIDKLHPEIISLKDVAPQLNLYLQAGSWLPLLSGAPYRLNGHRYLDGGVLWPDPLYAALQEGCTHVLCFNTTPGDAASEHSKRARIGLRYVLNRWSGGLGDAYFASRQRWDRDKAKLPIGQSANLDGASVTRLAPPPGSHKVKRLTTDRGELLDGARAGYLTGLSSFGPPANYACFSVIIPSS
jgi:predicted patatin/cPLA2 family phospholipase